jgi:arylsulfatase A-like enzyme/Tfp pilus assembly protein PilF
MVRKKVMKINKKILTRGFLLIIILGIVIYIFLLRPVLEKDPYAKNFESYQSLMEPLNLSDMNIIVFTIDTLRADHLECYGYDQVKTPNINRLAEEGILFKYAITQAPLTLPSHSSIFTGTFPLYHGVRDNGSFYLDENQITLAEVLKDKGYATAAFVAAFVLDSRWGLQQGFDHYYDNFDLTKYKTVSLDAVQRRGDEVLTEAYKWIGENQEQKFFGWIHLYDPHTPYDPPEPYKSQYSGKRFGLYDGEIAYVDQLIGEFRKFLEERKLLDKTLVVFTGDHGESLGEHKESAHGFFIYDAAVRVPLIIRFPGNKLSNTVLDNQVRSIDIMPTILHLVNTEVPDCVQGKSLLSLMLNKEAEDKLQAYSETYWPRYHYGWSELKSLRQDQYKFIDAPKPELYDVRDDPGELNNIIDEKASLAHEMKRKLDTLIKEHSIKGIDEIGPKRIDDDSLVKLQALGYIGSFRTSSKGRGEKRGDPKDKIELYNEIKVAQFFVTEKKMDQAIEKITAVLKIDPSVLEARYILGNIFSKQKKYDQAVAEYKKALEVDPDYYDAIFGLAMAYKGARKLDEAILGFKRLMEIDPRDTKPFLHLGDIYEERGELDEAQKYLESGVKLDPEGAVFHNNLSAVYLKKKMYDQAEKEIKAALEIERHIPLRNAHFNMALLHEARGTIDLAILEYKKEQETSPFNWKPDFNLGLLYTKAKDLEKAIQEFESCIEKNAEYAKAHIFLAKAYMDSGKDLNEAEKLAQQGLSLETDKQTAILGHFVLADIYNRMGRYGDSQRHADKARELQKSL